MLVERGRGEPDRRPGRNRGERWRVSPDGNRVPHSRGSTCGLVPVLGSTRPPVYKVSFWFKLDKTSFLSLATKKVLSNTEHVHSCTVDADGNCGDGKEVLAAVTDGSEGS